MRSTAPPAALIECGKAPVTAGDASPEGRHSSHSNSRSFNSGKRLELIPMGGDARQFALAALWRERCGGEDSDRNSRLIGTPRRHIGQSLGA